MNQFAVMQPGSPDLTGKSRAAQRTLVLAGLAHALHDGFTDMSYVLLPVWQAQFALVLSLKSQSVLKRCPAVADCFYRRSSVSKPLRLGNWIIAAVIDEDVGRRPGI